jgi:hypothetical protein
MHFTKNHPTINIVFENFNKYQSQHHSQCNLWKIIDLFLKISKKLEKNRRISKKIQCQHLVLNKNYRQ